MEILVAFVIGLLVFLIEIWIINILDSGEKVWFEKKKLIIAIAYLFCSAVFGKGNGMVVEIVSGFFWGSFAAAAYSDWQIKKAYDLSTLSAIVFAVVTLLIAKQSSERAVIGLVIFCVLQATLFRFAYGAADCMSCSAAAIYLTALGGGILTILWFLIITYLLVFITQLFRGNVNKWGNLKEAVPLIPYMAVALLVVM